MAGISRHGLVIIGISTGNAADLKHLHLVIFLHSSFLKYKKLIIASTDTYIRHVIAPPKLLLSFLIQLSVQFAMPCIKKFFVEYLKNSMDILSPKSYIVIL